ncbi:DUF4381 domain-containing protein [Thiomicrospira sp. WB1]|uniref:DUF4381 domain-containing protein n=1 Tax=Thiomicrospira sp. WB1 TaxID=1685380 RepID=UPI00074ADDB8|nr:DUF4381 domain-containing protein [Thiomicrospira sp. WB1]KUJ72268.1 hypothetical protein AVO41_00140 [Thiomicrospira sp. WB1]
MPALTPQQQALLAQLQDIHLPEPVGWWPPSQTLIGLLVGLGGILIGLLWYYLTQRRHNRYRREALARLDRIESESESEIDRLQAIQALLKQVAITQYGRTRVAALTDRNWADFLHQTALYLPQPEHLVDTFNWAYQYQQDASLPDTAPERIQAVRAYARRWIKGHHK